MQGWVSIHRSIMSSRTFARLTAIQKLIAIYIILNANHTDGYWYDQYKDIEVELKEGQLVTSVNKIVNEWFKKDNDVTTSKVRTALKRLEKVEFLTIETTNSYTLLTVCNYGVYQGERRSNDKRNDKDLARQSQGNDNAMTTNNNVKNVNNDNKSASSSKLKFETPHLQLAELLFKNMKVNNPKAKRPNMDNWADTIRKMMELDKREGKDIQDVIIFSQKHSFWHTNILSAGKLRDQFDKLYLQMKDNKKSVEKKVKVTPSNEPINMTLPED